MSPLTKKIQIQYSFLLSLLHVTSTDRSTNKVQTPSQTTGDSSLSFKTLSLCCSLYETSPQTTTDAEWAAKCEAVPLPILKGKCTVKEEEDAAVTVSVFFLRGGLRSCRGCLPTLDLLSLFLFFFVLSSLHQPLHLFYHHPGLRRTSMNGRGWKTVARSTFQIDISGHVACFHTPADGLQMLQEREGAEKCRKKILS